MKPLTVIFLGLVTTYTGIAALNPILAPLVRELGLSEVQGGLIITAAALMWSLTSPFWGRRSDLDGRKQTFLLGLCGYSIGFSLFGIFATQGINGVLAAPLAFALLMAARGLVGSFFPAVPVSAQAYIADATSGKERTAGIALLSAANAIGFIAGPAFGGALAGFGLLAPVVVAAALPLVAAALVLWRLPPTAPAPADRKRIQISPLDPRLRLLLPIGFVIVASFVSLQITAGFYLQDKLTLSAAATAALLGQVLVASGIVTLIAQFGIVRLFRVPPRRLLLVGLPTAVAGFLALIVAEGALALGAAFVAASFGISLALPGYVAAVTLAVNPEEQGTVAGLAASVQGFGAVIGPVASTALYAWSAPLPYMVGALLLTTVSLLIWLHPRLRQIAAPAAEPLVTPGPAD